MEVSFDSEAAPLTFRDENTNPRRPNSRYGHMGNPGFNTLLQKNTREKTEESFDPLSSEDPELRYMKVKEKCVNLQASNTALKQKIQEL